MEINMFIPTDFQVRCTSWLLTFIWFPNKGVNKRNRCRYKHYKHLFPLHSCIYFVIRYQGKVLAIENHEVINCDHLSHCDLLGLYFIVWVFCILSGCSCTWLMIIAHIRIFLLVIMYEIKLLRCSVGYCVLLSSYLSSKYIKFSLYQISVRLCPCIF